MPPAEPASPRGPGADHIVFLHIAKTAGTSLVAYFRKLLPPDQVFSHGDFLRYPQDQALPADVFEQNRFLSGHFGWVHIAPYLDRAYSFTFLRDPIERVLSFYRFCLHEDMQKNFAVARAAQALGLEGFLVSDLPEVAEMLDNQQTWQLARMYWRSDRQALAKVPADELLAMACEHLHRFSRVCLTEQFVPAFACILADLGLPVPARVPRELETRDPVLSAQVSTATMDRLRERMALDYRLYDYACRRLAPPGVSS